MVLRQPGISSEPGYLSAWPGFIETIRPGLGRSQPAPGGSERATPESRSFMQSQDTLCTGYGILSQGSRNVLCWLKLVSAFRDGFGSALQVFGDICTVDLACPCLHGMFLIGPKTRPFSPSARGNALPSSDLGDFMSLLSTTFRAHPCLVDYGQGVFLKAGWHCFLCCTRCVRTGDLEPCILVL